MGGKRGTPVQRFWPKVDKDGPVPEHCPELGPCWVWTKAKRDGYGCMFLSQGVVTQAHRFAYELMVGPIPDGLTLDHLCLNTACVNPSHLEPVTKAENSRRESKVSGFAVWQRRKTHCPQGHPYDQVNTCRSGGGRVCRTCKRERMRARRAVETGTVTAPRQWR